MIERNAGGCSCKTVQHALECARALQAVSDTPLLYCQLLLAHVLQTRRELLLSHGEHPLDRQQQQCFASLINRRGAGEPVARILGEKEFWNRTFKLSAATLIPRPETELLVATLLDRFPHQPRTLVDLGTGAGVIAISLAMERPAWQLIGVENSLPALRVARENGKDLTNIAWLAASWCDSLAPESVDIVVSNPPYIRSNDREHLQHLGFEPLTALAAGADGLDAIRRVVAQGFDCLKPAGHILIEHGYDQQRQVRQLLQQAGFSQLESLVDLQNIDRAVLAVKRWG